MGERVNIIEYGLGDRDELTELRERYSAMKNVLSDILDCGRWDIEDLFDSRNNIEVGEIIKDFVENTGKLPNWNQLYYDAVSKFAYDHDLEMGVDIDIYTNCSQDTTLYVREGLDKSVVEELEDLMGMDAEEMEVPTKEGEER